MQISLISRISAGALVVLGLAACDPNYQSGISPDAQRAAGGAVAGAVIAKALDEDIATGAALGGAAGAVRRCRCLPASLLILTDIAKRTGAAGVTTAPSLRKDI